MVSKDIDSFKIALLPGDGIGPEVLEAAISVLECVESCLKEVRFRFKEFSAQSSIWPVVTLSRQPYLMACGSLTPYSSAPWACRVFAGQMV
jgi:hypothetical protein